MKVIRWAQLRGEIIRTRNLALMQVYSAELLRGVVSAFELYGGDVYTIAAATGLDVRRVRKATEFLQTQGVLNEAFELVGKPEIKSFDDLETCATQIRQRFKCEEVLEQVTLERRPELAALQRRVLIEVLKAGETCSYSALGLTTKIYASGFPTIEFDVQCALLSLVDQHLLFERFEAAAGLAGRPSWSINWSEVSKRLPPKKEWRRSLLPMKQIANERRAREHAEDEFAAAACQLLERITYPTGLTHRRTQLRLMRLLLLEDGNNALNLKELANLEQCSGPRLNQKTLALALRELVSANLVGEHELGFRRFRWIRWTTITEHLRAAVAAESRGQSRDVYPVKPKATKPSDMQQELFGTVVVGNWDGNTESQAVAGKRTPTLAAIAAKYVYPQLRLRNRKRATLDSIKQSIRDWDAYFTADEFRNVRRIRSRHIEAWQKHLGSRKQRPLAAASINRKVRAVLQVLRAAERHRVIKRVPVVNMLAARAAGKSYLRPEQVQLLWKAAEAMQWPALSGITAAEFWKCAMVLYWTYGFRTQELISFQEEDRPALKWGSVTFEAETPNPDGTAFNALGWITYTPQKQSWAKPASLYLPLTASARAAFEVLEQSRTVGDDRVFPISFSSKQFYTAWRKLQRLAGVQMKNGEPFKLKAFRRSAATYLENHHRGLGAAVCGWADRDVSSVMAKHYQVTEDLLVEKLASYVVPDCFETLTVSAETV